MDCAGDGVRVKRSELEKAGLLIWQDDGGVSLSAINSAYSAGFRAGATEAVKHSRSNSVESFNDAVDFLRWLLSGADLEIADE